MLPMSMSLAASQLQLARVAALRVGCSLKTLQRHLGSMLPQEPKEVSVFPGAKGAFTNTMVFTDPTNATPMETYRVMDRNGKILVPEQDPNLPEETVLKMYRAMLTTQAIDIVLYEAQRQGRISFYITNSGEEGTQVGSALATDKGDMIYGQYRETGVLLWRGFSVAQCMNQCFSNNLDLGKGRQMPVHYGSKEFNFQTISSPLATQLPQAAGSAYSMKISGRGKVVLCYFGDGAASEGDAHAAMNFANTLSAPMLFICRNNGYAISTPTTEQYCGDGIASRGQGYGMRTIRVDGNDIFAVYSVTKAARTLALETNKPVLIEAMTYRVGHHSTSDDSSAYRSLQEINYWDKEDHPILRLKAYMTDKGWWDKEKEEAAKKEARKHILAEFNAAEKLPKPHIDHLFTDVFDKVPLHLQRQQAELHAHLAKYPDSYMLDQYAKE